MNFYNENVIGAVANMLISANERIKKKIELEEKKV